jgi:hypothetical protein
VAARGSPPEWRRPRASSYAVPMKAWILVLALTAGAMAHADDVARTGEAE